MKPLLENQPTYGLDVADWAVVAGYAALMLGIGFYYSRRHETSEDYHLGGRKLKPTMVGLSLYATMISTVSYLAVPGEILRHGPAFLTGILAIPFIYLIVGYLLIPHIMGLPIVSAYELLETRFGRPIRLLGSVIFLLMRFIWMGLVTFTSAKIVVGTAGLPEHYTPYISCIVGIVTVIYASMGGLQAVVLTDVIQTGVFFLGALVTIGLVTFKMGGFAWFPTEWAPNWDVQPLISFDPHVRATVFGMLMAQVVWWACTAGSDQMAIQRYLSTRDARTARRAFLVNNIADAVVTVMLCLLGFALLGFYRAHPEYLSAELNLDTNADYLFPHFIVRFFGFGTAGLVVSGMLAAAMSSLASGVNSTCTVIQVDILEYAFGKSTLERRRIHIAKVAAFTIGIVVILLSLVVGKVSGNLIEVTSKTSNILVASLFGLFFFAMFVPFSTALGAALGSLYGFLAAFLVSFWDLTGQEALSWQWILPTAVVADVVAGTLISLIPTRGRTTAWKAIWGAICTIPAIVILAAFVAACTGH